MRCLSGRVPPRPARSFLPGGASGCEDGHPRTPAAPRHPGGARLVQRVCPGHHPLTSEIRHSPHIGPRGYLFGPPNRSKILCTGSGPSDTSATSPPHSTAVQRGCGLLPPPTSDTVHGLATAARRPPIAPGGDGPAPTALLVRKRHEEMRRVADRRVAREADWWRLGPRLAWRGGGGWGGVAGRGLDTRRPPWDGPEQPPPPPDASEGPRAPPPRGARAVGWPAQW